VLAPGADWVEAMRPMVHVRSDETLRVA